MKKKSRTVLTVLAALSVVSLAAGAFFQNRALAIIGGADGPTAIYIARSVGPDPFFTAAAILAGAALGYYLVAKKKKKL